MENVVSRNFTQVEFTDQYGEKRVIHRFAGMNSLRVKKQQDSISHLLNRAAAELIGAKIKAKRIERGLTLDALHDKAGLTAASGRLGKNRMWEIETACRGHARRHSAGIRFGTLYALAVALECEVSELLPPAKEVALKAGVVLAAPEDERVMERKRTKRAVAAA